MAEDNLDPFHPNNVGAVQLIVQLRIYDVLMGIYRELDLDKAKRLQAAHAAGKVVGTWPFLNMTLEELDAN